MPDDRTPGLKWRAIERTGVTLDEFRAMLRYVPGTGLFYWRVNKKGPRRAGDVAGYTDKDGYICIGVSGYRYPAHRLAWLFTYGEWPTSDIDHKDGDRKNNRLSNLRIATRTQNNFNQKQLPTSVKSGLRGVRERSPGRWVASISFENRKFWLGTFDSREKAAAAYRERAEQLVGEFIGQLGDCHAE